MVTGNIGFHHIHHLTPRVPNYRLEACYRQRARLERATAADLHSRACAARR